MSASNPVSPSIQHLHQTPFVSDLPRLQSVLKDILADDSAYVASEASVAETSHLEAEILLQAVSSCGIDMNRGLAVRQARIWEEQNDGMPKAFGISADEIECGVVEATKDDVQAVQSALQRLVVELKEFWSEQAIPSKLSEEIRAYVQEYDRLATSLTLARIQTELQFQSCAKMLNRQIFLLTELMREHKLKKQVELDQATIDVLCLRVKALCAKLDVIKNRLRRDTYTPEAVQALRFIREGLKREIQAEQASYNNTVRQLQDYEGIDEFDALVIEYADVQKKIRLQKELLHQVNDST